MRLTARHLNRATLARQGLLARDDLTVVETVRRVLALQAQEPASPYLALWNRIERFDAADLDAAFADGEIVRATLMRITLHAVAAGDYTTFHETMRSNLRGAGLHDRRFRTSGLSMEEFDAMLPDLVVFAGTPRTKPEFETFLAERFGRPQPAGVWRALKMVAPLTHAVTGPPWSFGRVAAFRAAPTVPERPQPEEGAQVLARRYLEAFGPATPEDFARFAVHYRPVARDAFAALGDLVYHQGPDGELADIRGGVIPDPDTPAPPRLLGMWDSVLLAHDDCGRVIPPEYRSQVIRRNGDVLPTVLVDGRVQGVWRVIDDGVEVTALATWDEAVWHGIVAEARRLAAFLQARDPQVYRRYHHWWESLPAVEVRTVAAQGA